MEDNLQTKLAFDIIEKTSKNLFLTGKAGTGKTTFLRNLIQHTNKKHAIAAPTGVAAINAKGVTLHSLFQLPIGTFLPVRQQMEHSGAVLDVYTLFKNLRLSSEKIKLLTELELLIIDEVSMMRCDMLDAINEILMHYRGRRREPFGGVQVLFIGDLLQLPPVVSDYEWSILQQYYQSPYFFSAQVLQQHSPLKIELQKVYRQQDPTFISLLNDIRNNNLEHEDFEKLDSLYKPLAPNERPSGIILTTHNRTADEINYAELGKLEGSLFVFKGEVSGEFSEKTFPVDPELRLKNGAKVMFVKNDTLQLEKRFYNGKLATIVEINQEKIKVKTEEDNLEFYIEKEVWKNIRYKYNQASDKIEEQELGRYTQFPIRLAWAITIHKSQGLTFDNVAIDAGASFASGQVYVALSRCRSLEGIRLLSKIRPQNIIADDRIVAYNREFDGDVELNALIEKEFPLYQAKKIIKNFEWNKIEAELRDFLQFTREKQFDGAQDAVTLCIQLLNKANELAKVSQKFTSKLSGVQATETTFNADTANFIKRAIEYFTKALVEEMISPLRKLISQTRVKKKVTQFVSHAEATEALLCAKVLELQGTRYFETSLGDKDKAINLLYDHKPLIEKPTQMAVQKKEKGETQKITLELYKQGKTIGAIATERGLTTATIEGHLAQFVAMGELPISDFLNESQLKKIEMATKEQDTLALTPLKESLGEQFSYGLLRIGIEYLKAKSKLVNS